jgi:hypothetical protein
MTLTSDETFIRVKFFFVGNDERHRVNNMTLLKVKFDVARSLACLETVFDVRH